MKALWNNQVIASSNQTQVVEGNHYFPPAALQMQFFKPSNKQTICSWKGTASYFDVVVGDSVNDAAAWFYPDPKSAASNIAGYVAFWKGVQVIAD